MRLIDADKLKDEFIAEQELWHYTGIRAWIDSAPTVDAVENAHKKRAKKLVGIPHTDEHKEKISKSLKEYYQTNKSASIGRVSKKNKRVIGVKGNEVFHFDSICEASKFVNGARANITRSCNSESKTAYGYKWMFENDFCSYGERKENDR